MFVEVVRLVLAPEGQYVGRLRARATCRTFDPYGAAEVMLALLQTCGPYGPWSLDISTQLRSLWSAETCRRFSRARSAPREAGMAPRRPGGAGLKHIGSCKMQIANLQSL